MASRRVRVMVVAAACSLGVSPAVAGAASPAATTWAGWDAPGPLGVGAPTAVAGSDGTSVVIGGRGNDKAVPIAVAGPGGSRVGRVPVDNTPGPLALAGSDRILLADGCRIRRSTDQGLSWTAVPLASCDAAAGPSRFTVLNADVAFVSAAARTWRTLDGGVTWNLVNGATSGPQAVLDADTGFRIVSPTANVFALQRTVDAGGSWQGLKVPNTQAPPPKPDVEPPAAVDSLPAMAGIARRSDGAILVGAGSTLLVTTDRGATFTRREVPVPDDLPGAPSVVVDAVVCDPAGTCAVGVHAANDSARRSALRFVGDAFVGRIAALPPGDAQALGPNAIVGMSADSPSRAALRTDDLGGTPYRAIASAADRPGSIGVHGLLAIRSVSRLHVSSDHGASWYDVPDLAAPSLLQVASNGKLLVGLADDGTLWRYADGTWTRQSDLSSIKPAAMAVSAGVPIVVGSRGVSRLADLAKPTPVSAPVLSGRGFANVVAQGRTVIAWKGRTAVRSTDGGKRWTRAKLPAGASDVQLVTPKVAYALVKGTLLRSKNAGASFKRQITVPNLRGGGPVGADASASGTIEFNSATSGVLLTGLGTYVTDDGGKTVRVLPTPGALKPAVASVFGSGVVVQDPVVGAVFRAPGLLKQREPTLTLSNAQRAKKGGKGRRLRARTVTVVGILRGVDGDQPVAVMSVDRKGRPATVKQVVEPNADGSFRLKVRLSNRESGVQAWFRGAVGTARTAMSATSKVLAVR